MMCRIHGIAAVTRRRCRGVRFLAAVLALALGAGFVVSDESVGQSLSVFEDRVEAALAATETALAAAEAQLDDLAVSHRRRTLADGRPSVAQAAANVRLWERRIRELEVGGRELREELNDVLVSFDADIAALAERLSAQFEQAERQQAERVWAEREHAKRERAVGRVFRDCPACPEMVVVPSGHFDMGSSPSEVGRSDSEGPVRRVTIGHRFAVGIHEVTQGEFARFAAATNRPMGNSCWTYEDRAWKDRAERHWRNPGFRQTDRHPVVCVSWEDARAYAAWLSRQTGAGYRLLSEAEWEYAARAGTSAARYWEESEPDQCRHANGADTDEKVCNDGHARTAPVGSYAANAYGLHDVLGNVWEWTQDCWNDGYDGAPSDGRAWKSGTCRQRVVRGGSWINRPQFLRAAFRVRNLPTYRSANFGFRVARVLIARGTDVHAKDD